MGKDQSKKKKASKKEKICQPYANGVCDVPSEKLVNNPAIIHRQINRYPFKLSQVFLNPKTYSKRVQDPVKFQLFFGIRKHSRIFHLYMSDCKG